MTSSSPSRSRWASWPGRWRTWTIVWPGVYATWSSRSSAFLLRQRPLSCFPWPWLFALGLTLSTSGFILLGGLGQRYATIAFGALLIAIYTMLGASLYDQWYQQPVLLLLGAIWYNLLTLTGHLIFPVRPLQDNLARSFEQLAHYLELKSRLFDPDIEEESQAPLYDLALANGQLVATLNQTKASLLTRLRGDRGQRGTRRTLHYYFAAQDIHERASSSHVQYAALREKFRYSDVMFRFQRLLSMQSQACQQLSRSILLRTPYQHDPRFERVFSHLDAALDRVQASGTSPEHIKALGFLLNNLRAIDAQLATIESEQAMALPGSEVDNQLADDSVHSFSGYVATAKPQLYAEVGSLPPRGTHVAGAVRGLCLYSDNRASPRLLDPC